MKLLALCVSRFVRKITSGGILSEQVFEKKLAELGKKPVRTKQEEDWEAQKFALSFFKKAVRRAKRDSWRSFVESTSSLTPTARLIKII